jgi:hypothetical protein
MCDSDDSISSLEISDILLAGFQDHSVDTKIEALKALSKMMCHDGDSMRGDTSRRERLIGHAFGVSPSSKLCLDSLNTSVLKGYHGQPEIQLWNNWSSWQMRDRRFSCQGSILLSHGYSRK